MCCGLEQLKHKPSPTISNISFEDIRHPSEDMNHLTVETENTFASLLELAANNDVEGFKRFIEHDPSGVNEVRLCIDVIKLILSSSDADVNYLLLAAGADANMVDANGHLPVDVIVVPPRLQTVKLTLKELLATENSVLERNLRVPTAVANSNSPPSLFKENGSPPSGSDSPIKSKSTDAPISFTLERKEYLIDPSVLDIKNSIYSTDEFRMYSFKRRMLEEGILGSSITVVFLGLIFARGHVGMEICVDMLMVFLNASYTLLNIEPGCARIVNDLWGQPQFKALDLEFDQPMRELGFHGVPHKASAFKVPTSNCLFELIETSFVVITLSEIEIVNLGRVGLG
ncbi:hypothetical protein REPUB_Repub04eG0154200 [Reevesia pubescens]